jgi:hypothetical protein
VLEFLAAHRTEILVNTISSIPFFILDTIIIALLVPVSVWYFNRMKWKEIRSRFLVDLLEDQREMGESINYKFKNLGDHLSSGHYLFTKSMEGDWEIAFKDLNDRAAGLTGKIEAGSSFYAIAMTPDLILSLIEWRDALGFYASEIQDMNIRLWWMVMGGRHQALAETNDEMIARYKAAQDRLVAIADTIAANKEVPYATPRGMELTVPLKLSEHLSLFSFEHFLGGAEDAAERRADGSDEIGEP